MIITIVEASSRANELHFQKNPDSHNYMLAILEDVEHPGPLWLAVTKAQNYGLIRLLENTIDTEVVISCICRAPRTPLASCYNSTKLWTD